MASKVFSGGTPQTTKLEYWGGPHYWLSSGETSNRFIIKTEKTITDLGVRESATRKADKYSVVIASAGQGHTRGQTSLLFTETYVNQSIIVVSAPRVLLPFIYWNLTSRYEEMRALSDSNSIRGSLTTKMIGSLLMPVLSETDLITFSEFAWPIIQQIENHAYESDKLISARDSMLPKLMSGEIDADNIEV